MSNSFDPAEFIRQEAASVAMIADSLGAEFDSAVAELVRCEGKVIVTGAGTSGAIARRMAHLFNVTGTPAIYQNSSDALHGSSAVVTDRDLLVALSKGGESQEINGFIRIAKDRGARVLALSSATENTMNSLADVKVYISAGTGDPQGIIAMGSTLVYAAWGDALAMKVMETRGYSWESVLHSHPGGAVGKYADSLRKQIRL